MTSHKKTLHLPRFIVTFVRFNIFTARRRYA